MGSRCCGVRCLAQEHLGKEVDSQPTFQSLSRESRNQTTNRPITQRLVCVYLWHLSRHRYKIMQHEWNIPYSWSFSGINSSNIIPLKLVCTFRFVWVQMWESHSQKESMWMNEILRTVCSGMTVSPDAKHLNRYNHLSDAIPWMSIFPPQQHRSNHTIIPPKQTPPSEKTDIVEAVYGEHWMTRCSLPRWITMQTTRDSSPEVQISQQKAPCKTSRTAELLLCFYQQSQF